MKSLKNTLFIVFAALSLVISFGVGMIIYAQYSAYIKGNYESTLKRVLEMVSKYLPILNDPEAIVREGEDRSEVYTNICIELQKIADITNVEDFAIFDRQGTTFRFLFGIYPEGDPLWIFNEDLFLAPYEPEGSAAKGIDLAYTTKTFQITPSPYTDEFGTHVSGYLPLITNGSITTLLTVDFAVSYVDALHQKAYFALLVSMILAGVLATIGAYVFTSFLVKPINHVTQAAKELAQAHFDIDIPVTTKNEIGGQQQALCTIRDNLKHLVSTLNLQVQKLNTISINLKDAVKKSFSDVAVIVSQMNSVQNEADSQITMVAVTTDSTKRIVSHINDLDGAIHTQATNIVQSSAAIEQMIAHTSNIRSTVNHSANLTENLTGLSQTGQQIIQRLGEEYRLIA